MALRGLLLVGYMIPAVLIPRVAFAQGGGGSNSNVAEQQEVVKSSPAVTEEQDAGGISDIVVTAQKRAENLQDVPLAVSALSQATLQATGVTGASELRTQIPNLNFSRTSVNGANFSIRGIGAKLVAPSGDGGVGVHLNNAPLTTSRVSDADFYDIERVEVLRGPQGTLYGRNATGGVLNTITAKPTDRLSASLTGEIGNYGSINLRGFVNVPLGDIFSIRAAGYYLNREGFSLNETTGRAADDRDLFATRLTVGIRPSSTIKAFLLWEHFDEEDRRLRGNKNACTPDPGPNTVGGVPVNNAIARGLLSQGCLPRSIYSTDALGAPNTLGTLEGGTGILTGTLPFNANAGVAQNPNLRRFSSTVDPIYRAKNDLVQFNVEWGIGDTLTFSSLSSYSKDKFDTQSRLESHVATGAFRTTAFSPGGVVTDPQLGLLSEPTFYQRSKRDTEQFSQELRIQSDLVGPINFNFGGIYIDLDASQDIVFVASSYNLRSRFLNQTGAGIYIDQNVDIDFTGHNYFIARQDYKLKSKAAFGEVYWKVTDSLKLTGGLRYTDDEKQVTEYKNPLFTPGRGVVPQDKLTASFKEVTGRFNIAWNPTLAFTDNSLFFASYSKGYKGGGFNPTSGGGMVDPTFRPEFVNAYEVGTKNTLMDGRIFFNATAFHYDYVDYQVARVTGIAVANENIDAKIMGAEIEAIARPFRGVRLNTNLGFLRTKIGASSSIDELNQTQGDPSLTLVKAASGGNCLANTSALTGIIAGINTGAIPASALLGLCAGSFASRGIVLSTGRPVDLSGKQLPDAPRWTMSIGAQYDVDLTSNWDMSLRADYYRQGTSFSRIYNSEVDRLKSYQNLNLSLLLRNVGQGFTIQGFVRNATNETVIVSSIPSGPTRGLSSALFLNDPRTYGVGLTKSF